MLLCSRIGMNGEQRTVFGHTDERILVSNQRVTITGRQSVPINISEMTSLQQSRQDKMVTTHQRDIESRRKT